LRPLAEEEDVRGIPREQRDRHDDMALQGQADQQGHARVEDARLLRPKIALKIDFPHFLARKKDEGKGCAGDDSGFEKNSSAADNRDSIGDQERRM